MSKVHEIVTEKILEALDRGVVPWARPWKVALPFNAKSGRKYRGINALLLDISGRGPGFITPKVAQELGANFKGVKTELVTFYAPVPASKKKVAAGEASADDTFLLLRYYTVLPVSEVKGLPDAYYERNSVVQAEHQPIEEAEHIIAQFVERTGVKIVFGGSKACYRPSTDEIHMPPRNSFISIEEYYSTIFHEMVHATEHKDRCNIKEDYASNELRAEIGASVLLSHVGLDLSAVLENTASYCDGWSKRIRGERKTLVMQAASKAYSAVDYVLNAELEQEKAA